MVIKIMRTRKIYLVMFLLLFYNSIYSQSISKQVIAAAGKTQTNSNLKISWTIGEPVVGLMTAGGSQIANGYYQALNLTLLSTDESDEIREINVYPNPSTQSIYVSHPNLDKFQFQIIDVNGKQIISGILENNAPLDISNFNNGIYFIIIENIENKTKKTYKIIKS